MTVRPRFKSGRHNDEHAAVFDERRSFSIPIVLAADTEIADIVTHALNESPVGRNMAAYLLDNDAFGFEVDDDIDEFERDDAVTDLLKELHDTLMPIEQFTDHSGVKRFAKDDDAATKESSLAGAQITYGQLRRLAKLAADVRKVLEESDD